MHAHPWPYNGLDFLFSSKYAMYGVLVTTKQSQVVVSQGAAAALFPFEDENDDLHWDEYGAALCPEEFQLKSASRPGQLQSPDISCAAAVCNNLDDSQHMLGTGTPGIHKLHLVC